MAFINGKEVLFSTVLTKWGVVQTKGDSVNEVMSQKAVTDELNTLGDKIDNVGCAIVVDNYSELVYLLDASSADDYRLGQNIYVRQSDVPDLWISDVDPDNQISYHYSTDEQFIADINDAAALYRLNIGHYAVSVLETEKVDLSAYPTRTDMATSINNALVPTKADVADLKTKVSRTEKRIMNLEKGLPDDDFVTDSTSAYVRDVPSNALPFAEITEIGGMTRKCTNLIHYPYYANGTHTLNGVTWTVKADGSVTANGTATANSIFVIANYNIKVSADTYVLSGIPTNGSAKTFMIQTADRNGFARNNTNASGDVFTLTAKTSVLIQLVVFNGYTANNLVFKPMLNKGETALPYEPFFEGLRSAPVTEVVSEGANLTTAQAIYKGAQRYEELVADGRNCIRFTSGASYETTPITFKPNTQYTVSFYAKGENFGGAEGANTAFSFYYDDGTYSRVLVGQDSPWSFISLTSTNGKTVRAIGVTANEYRAYVYLDIDTFMLNKGTTALPYRPYIKRTLPIPEAVRPAHGIPNTDCYDRIRWRYDEATDKWLRDSEKRVGVVDMGTLNWKYYPDIGYFYA